MRWPIALTWAGLLAERVAQAFWPAWVVAGFAGAMVLAGWADLAPRALVLAVLALAGVALLAAVIWGARRMALPARDLALARMDAGLRGRPLAALRDVQAMGRDDPQSAAIWQAHLAQMQRASRAARAVPPAFDLPARDPMGLRLLALLALLAALLFGPAGRIGALGDLARGAGPAVAASGPVWEGWITPPAYTGKPALYLADQPQGDLAVPIGSRVSLRLYDSGAAVVQDVTDAPIAQGDAPAFDITRSGDLAIAGATWRVIAQADQPPFVEMITPISADADGMLTQAFRAGDDYAVTAGRAIITLDLGAVDRRYGLAAAPDPIAGLVLDLPLPFGGDRSDFDAFLTENLSQHVLANLPVTLQLQVTDDAGQSAVSLPEPLILPGRRFFQPVARAVIEQRRDLLWSRSNARRVGQVLRAISYQPDDLFADHATYLRLRAIIRRLDDLPAAGLDAALQTELAAALWDLAVQLEDGRLSDARERLRRAQERLSEAMRNGASDAEIAELMRELRAATDDYLQMLAEQADPSDGTDQVDNSDQMQPLGADELQAMMDRIEELMQQGRMAEAQALMDQLAQMMENLRVTQGQGQQGQGQGQAQQELSETLREQQQLADDAFGQLQGQAQGENGQGAGDLAQRQDQLRQDLRGTAPALDGPAADALDRATGAMEGAEDALRQGDLPRALDQQAEAIEALRDGLRALAQDDTAARDSAGAPTDSGGRDPLGRETGGARAMGGDAPLLEGPDAPRSADALREEIRRRAAQADRPAPEREYLRRLLEPF